MPSQLISILRPLGFNTLIITLSICTLVFSTIQFISTFLITADLMDDATPHKISCIIPTTTLQKLAREWLLEDTPSFDLAALVVGDKPEQCVLLCKSPGVLSGVPFFTAIFQELNCSVTWEFEEGSYIDKVPCRVATVTGPASCILQGERPALNCLARASGVATHARELRAIRDAHKWTGQIAGTRKTTPGFRLVEKYSLLVGGISTHRYNTHYISIHDNGHV